MFIFRSIMKGMDSDIVILAHINFSLPAMLIRLFNQRCKIWLIAYGTNVWRPLKRWKNQSSSRPHYLY